MLGSGGTFYYDNNTFGDVIYLATVISTIKAASTGIINVSVTQLNTTNAATAADITLAANQIPFLTAANLIINATGGI